MTSGAVLPALRRIAARATRTLRAGLLPIPVLALLLTGCAVNPVTGKQELHLVSERQEIAMGEQNYTPGQQSQGGPYVADPDVVRYVREVGRRLAAVSDRPELPYEFVVLNNSVPNAWAMPGGKLAVNRGLLVELESEAELAAVLGHEIVHAAARHSAKEMERGILFGAAVLGVGIATGDNENGQLIAGATQLGAGLLNLKYGRDAELESDYYGTRYMAKAGYDPRAAVDLQETFLRLSEGKDPGWLEGLLSTHPPSRERVQANRKTAEALGTRGRIGREEYEAGIGHLKRVKPAYDRYDEGVKALAKGDVQQALAAAEEAIAIEPNEALFHELRGDALQKRKRLPEAERAYDKAIALNPEYFRFYLQRGLLHRQQGERRAAQADLEKSVELLPTALAHNSLGSMALAEGQRRRGIEHLRIAASSESPEGRDAAASLARLTVSEQPEAYIAVGLRPVGGGLVEVLVQNRAPIAVRRVVVVTVPRGGGLPDTHRLRGILEPGRSAVVGRFRGEPDAVAARVRRAEPAE